LGRGALLGMLWGRRLFKGTVQVRQDLDKECGGGPAWAQKKRILGNNQRKKTLH